jgi:hypothetical protein
MTLPEAHTRLRTIVAAVRPGLAAAEVVALQTKLLALIEDLPISAEFDPTAAALGEIAGKLQGQLTQAVFDELKSRTAILGAAVATLAKVTREAAADARILSFEKPKVLAAGLKNGIALVEALQQAAKAGDVGVVSQNAEALLAVLATLRDNLKIG